MRLQGPDFIQFWVQGINLVLLLDAITGKKNRCCDFNEKQ